MPPALPSERWEIGPFQLDIRTEALLRDGIALPLGRRAAGLLRVLLDHAGEVVTKDELIEQCWGGFAVEESNLTAQIAALRRAFASEPRAAGWIETLPRRGYRFTGPAEWHGSGGGSPIAAPMPAATPASGAGSRPSLAVFPFGVTPPDAAPQYTADGLVEDVIAALASLTELQVISRGSTFRFRGADVDLPQAARELGARYVVSGSVRHSHNQVNIPVELADAGTGTVLMSRSFACAACAMIDTSNRIVRDIVRTIAPTVRHEELQRIRLTPPESLAAYDLVLHARALIHRLDRAEFEQAEPLLMRAIEIDPGYAAAHALKAEWHSLRFGQGWSTDRDSDVRLMEQCARIAISFDPTEARGLLRLAHTRSFIHRDYDTALALFGRALEASPGNAEAWMWSSCTFSYIDGGAEAVARATHALELSPRDWFGFQFRSTLCIAHYTAGAFAEAVTAGLASLAENPEYLSNARYLIAALVAAGERDHAARLARDLLQRDPAFSVTAYARGHPFRDAGRRKRLAAQLLEAGLPA